jgi:arylsulfatase A-like enzyme
VENWLLRSERQAVESETPTTGVQAAWRTIASAEQIVVVLLVFNFLSRLWVALATPLPPDHLVPWLLHGLVQDLCVAPLAALGPVMASFIWPRRGVALRWGFAVIVIVLGLLQHLWGEVVVALGHPPAREDLELAMQTGFLAKSIDAGDSVRIALASGLLAGLVIAAAWRTARVGRHRVVLLGGIAVSSCIIAISPFLRVHLADSADNVVLGLIRTFHEEHAAIPGPLRPKTRLSSPFPNLRVRELMPHSLAGRYASDQFPLAHASVDRSAQATSIAPGARPNIVLIVMEGVRANEIGAYGGSLPGLTPNLDQIAARGIAIDRVYSTGTHTPEGELGLWYGLLALPDQILMLDSPGVRLTGIPELFASAGWKTFLWIHGGDQTFYHRQRFYDPRGVLTVDGRHFAETEPRTNWGYSDRTLARRTLVALDNLEEPFVAMMLTVSNHFPFQLPPDADSSFDVGAGASGPGATTDARTELMGDQTERMLGTIHYTDRAVGEFLDHASRKTWYSRTIFVISSDHGLPIAPVGPRPSAHQFAELRHRIPLIFFSPLLHGGSRVPGPASQVDVLPTLLGLCRIRATSSAIGSDLLDPSSLDPERPVIAWDAEAQTITIAIAARVYHAHVQSTADDGRPLLTDELLVDPSNDPGGTSNLASREWRVLSEMRLRAEIYLSLYPSIVLESRSGIGVVGRSAATPLSSAP